MSNIVVLYLLCSLLAPHNITCTEFLSEKKKWLFFHIYSTIMKSEKYKAAYAMSLPHF